jgi:uncharacterized protein YoxC
MSCRCEYLLSIHRDWNLLMSTANSLEHDVQPKAAAELLEFMAQFSQLVDLHVGTVRKILLDTVDATMASVMAINAATDFKLMKAEEVLLKDKDASYVSKRAKDIDTNFTDPTEKVRHVSSALSAHMAGLTTLDESVRACLFSIMGGLGVDDVVRQRLEHVSTAMQALQEGVKGIMKHNENGATFSEKDFQSIRQEMLSKMFKAFTMEDEKKVFSGVFGSVPGINQKS